MPGGKTHMTIGVGVGLALGAALPASVHLPWELGMTVGLAAIGALAPDLDIADNELEELARNEGRYAARRLRRAGRRQGCLGRVLSASLGALVTAAGELLSRLTEGIAWLIQRVTTHRGLTHSLAGTVFVVLAAILLSMLLSPSYNGWWGVAWGAGWISHLAADALTFSGLKLLQPWSQQRFWLVPRGLRFRVGSWPEDMLRTVAPAAGLLVLLLAHGLLEVLGVALGG